MDIRSILSQPPLFSEMRQQSVVFWKNIELNDMLYWVLNEEVDFDQAMNVLKNIVKLYSFLTLI